MLFCPFDDMANIENEECITGWKILFGPGASTKSESLHTLTVKRENNCKMIGHGANFTKVFHPILLKPRRAGFWRKEKIPGGGVFEPLTRSGMN